MLSFRSLVLTMILTGSSIEARKLSLRAPGSRRLSFKAIGSFDPKTLVTDHANIDKDQAAIEDLLAVGTDAAFQQARDIYREGSFSKSRAEITLDPATTKPILADTVISGTNEDGAIVAGTVVDEVAAGGTSITIQYKTNLDGGSTCNVGGNPNPVLDGCFQAVGTLTIEGEASSLAYTYVPITDNKNGRNIQGFSTDFAKRMVSFVTGEYYEDFQKFVTYYGTETYADEFVTQGFIGGQTQFENGNADFSDYSFTSRAEIIKKGTVFLHTAMYVIREMEDAIDDCNKGCATPECNDDAVHALDEAVAFYTGSLDAKDDGKLMYALADKRCENFKTCGRDGDAEEGISKVNFNIFAGFDQMQTALLAKQCDSAAVAKERVVKQIFVPFVQGTIRYAYFTGVLPDGTEKAEAEGVAFAAAVLPVVHACSPKDAQIIYDSMQTGQGNTADFSAVKRAFERNYNCMGITCQDVGGLWDDVTQSYSEGASPCTGGDDNNVGLAIGLVVGGLVAVAFLAFLFKRRRATQTEDVKGNGQIS